MTSSDDFTARIWEVTPRGQLQVLSGHTAAVNGARFSPDGRQVVTVSTTPPHASGTPPPAANCNVSRATRRRYRPPRSHRTAATSSRLRPIGPRASGKWRREVRCAQFKHDDQVTTTVFSHDGRRLVTASIDRTAHVWDASSGQHLVLLSGHTDLVGSATFSPDDTRVVTASSDQTARVWDARSGRQAHGAARAHRPGLVGAILAGWPPHRDRLQRSHRAPLGRAHRCRGSSAGSGLAENVSSADFSPDGRRVVLSVDDRTARIWDLASNRQVLALSGHLELMQFASFAPDGQRIVTASDDATARIWDTQYAADCDADCLGRGRGV